MRIFLFGKLHFNDVWIYLAHRFLFSIYALPVGNANRILNQKTKDLNYKNENHIFIGCALEMQKKKNRAKNA